MSTALARRLRKLELTTTDASTEAIRRQRIAEGKCPDCGYEHRKLPSHGGPWRCCVCGNRFVLQPGPACVQTCPVVGRHGCNARQIPTADPPGHEAWFAERRSRRATDDLCESMAPEHWSVAETWMQQHCPDRQDVVRPGESWYAMLARHQPPALVRAAWFLIAYHAETGYSVCLPPEVAEVYLGDPDALPARECAGCYYPLPTRVRIRPDDTYKHLGGVYLGVCPVCGLDTHGGDERLDSFDSR
jgi:hypothetical protein